MGAQAAWIQGHLPHIRPSLEVKRDMGACGSKKAGEPGVQANVCAEGAPVLLTESGNEKDQIKTAPVEEKAVEAQPCAPTEEPTSAALAAKQEPEPAAQAEAEAPEVAASPEPTPKESFEAALAFLKSPANSMTGVPNERKLNLYKFYKQATEGNVKGSQPWAAQIEARAKWDAWNSAKGLSSEDAMKRYVEELESQKQQFGK